MSCKYWTNTRMRAWLSTIQMIPYGTAALPAWCHKHRLWPEPTDKGCGVSGKHGFFLWSYAVHIHETTWNSEAPLPWVASLPVIAVIKTRCHWSIGCIGAYFFCDSFLSHLLISADEVVGIKKSAEENLLNGTFWSQCRGGTWCHWNRTCRCWETGKIPSGMTNIAMENVWKWSLIDL